MSPFDPFSPADDSAESSWHVGDRVLAQWEPGFLYAGSIEEIADDRALVRFDDGDVGWVDYAAIRSVALRIGDRVMSRRDMGPTFFPGVIEELDGEEFFIDFADGRQEWENIAALRIPCEPLGDPARPVSMTSHLAFLDRLKEGDRVWAIWNAAAYFPGSVLELEGVQANVRFDDGDRAWVFFRDLLPLDVLPGMRVLYRRRDGEGFVLGTVADHEGERILVRFDDESIREQWTTVESLARPIVMR
ncbi:MAG: hypothetical protein QM811_04270 [Pirellulales bacterium]